MSSTKPDLLSTSESISRQALRLLPDSFEDQIYLLQKEITAAQPNSNHGKSTVALAVLIATGCRASELQEGVLFKLIRGGLLVGVRESKYKKNSKKSIIQREFLLKDQHRNYATSYLFNFAANLGREFEISMSADRITKIVNNLSKKYQSELRRKDKNLQITPQTFRLLFIKQMSYSKFFNIEEIQKICSIPSKRSLNNAIAKINHKAPTYKWVEFIRYSQL